MAGEESTTTTEGGPQTMIPPNVDVGVFWDFENVRIPREVKASGVSSKIREALLQHGQIVEQNLYYDSRKVQEQSTDRVNLDQTGWHLVDCPARHSKETLDKKLIVDMMCFAWVHRSRQIPCCVVLITSDGDYSYTLAKIRNLGAKTVVVYGSATSTAGVLLDTCEIALSWVHDVLAHTPGDEDDSSAEGELNPSSEASRVEGYPQLENDSRALERSIGDAADGRHLTFLYSIRDLPKRPDGWTTEASVAVAFYKKRGRVERDAYVNIRNSAIKGGFVECGRLQLGVKRIVAVASCAWDPSYQGRVSLEIYVRLTQYGATQLDANTVEAAGMVLRAYVVGENVSSSYDPECRGESPRSGGLETPPKNPKYKSQLCAYFAKDGVCPNGAACDFAHGAHELRRLPAKGETTRKIVVPCRYWTGRPGSCHNGDKCDFAHALTSPRAPPAPLPTVLLDGLPRHPGLASALRPPESTSFSVPDIFRPTNGQPEPRLQERPNCPS